MKKMTFKQKVATENKAKPLISTSLRVKFLLLGCILAITLLSFFSVLNSNFTNWDEKSYVLDNQQLNQPILQGVKHFFKNNYYVANYHPLTMIVYMIEYHFAKLNPQLYHAINLFIHLLNVILVFIFIYLLSDKKIEVAVVVTIFFGIHPLHVESVAWIAELKDVLYTFFFLGGLITYYFYLQGKRKSLYYFMTLILFLLSLFSKAAAVTFPMVLILLDYYKLRKINIKAFLEKIPFFAIAIIFGIINLNAQETSITKVESHSIIKGVFLASYSMMNYIIKFVIPINLSALNPLPDLHSTNLPIVYYFAPFVALGMFILIYKTIKTTRIISFGFLFFFINIALVLQFIPVGGAIVADRYTYVPYIGLLFIIGMGFSWVYRSENTKIAPYKSLAIVTIIIFSITFAFLTNARCKVWQNSDTLWSDVINKYPDCWQGYLGRAEYFMNTAKYNVAPHDDDIDKAFNDLNTAIALSNNNAHAYLDRGLIYAMKGNPDAALSDYSKVLSLGYKEYNIYMAMGTTFSGIHQYDSAFKYFEMVVKLHGEDAQLLQNRGFTYLMVGKNMEAVEDYTKLINGGTKDASFYYFRGCAFYKIEHYQEAINDYSKAIDIKPDYAMAYYNRSLVYYDLLNNKDALKDAIKAKNMGFKVEDAYLQELKNDGQ